MRGGLVAAVVLLAGCAGPDAASPAAEVAESSLTLWLTRDGFSDAAPEGDEHERVPAGNFFRAWASGRGLPMWTGGAPEEDVVVTNATVVVWAQAPRGSAQAGRFPSFIAYLGPAPFLMGQASLPPSGVVPPGDERELTFELALPVGGVVVRTGETLLLIVTPVQTNDDAADPAWFLLGSAGYPSRVELVVEPVALPEEGDVSTDGRNGRVVGSAYALGAAPGTTAVRFPVDLPDDPARVEVVMEVTSNVGIPDVDFSVLSESGDVLASSVTPYGREAARLLGPQLAGLGGTTLQVEVVNYGSAVADFTLGTEVARVASG